jgi:hypothetical protein
MSSNNCLSHILLHFFISNSNEFSFLHFLSDGWFGIFRVLSISNVLLLDWLETIDNLPPGQDGVELL